MARLVPALLCFSLIFSAAGAADPVPPSATDTYISARDRAIAAVQAHHKSGNDNKAVAKALADLEPLLRAAVPAWEAPGFPAAGKLNLSFYDDPETGLSVLNGLVYRAGDTSVVVTNRKLLLLWLKDYNGSAIEPNEISVARWIKDHNAGRAKVKVPGSIPAAFRSENFWTFALATDAAAHLRGLVLVKGARGTDVATAEAGLFAQYEATDQEVDTLLVAVVRGDRVFVARQKLTVKLERPAICKKALDQTLTKSAAALKAYQDSIKDQPPGKDTSRFDESIAYEAKASREYRACFAQNLRTQPNYAAVQKQAQALVDLLH